MTILRAGNQAYRSLADVLDLPGTEHLGRVDIGVSQPVHGLERIVEAGLVVNWLMHKEGTAAGAGAVDLDTRPRFRPDWTVVFRDRQQVASPVAVPEDHDFYLLDVGFFDDTSQINSGTVYRRHGGTFFATVLIPIWYSDQAITAPGGRVLVPQGKDNGFPFFSAAENHRPDTFGVRFNTGGATNYAISFRGISAPPGVLPRL